MIKSIPITEYEKAEDDILVDLRDKQLFRDETLPGAINIPMNEISALYSLPKNKRIVLFCQHGDYSKEIAQLLSDNGYDTADLAGGWLKWLAQFYM